MKPIAKELAVQVVEETLAPLRDLLPDTLLVAMREELLYGLVEHPTTCELLDRAALRVVPEASGVDGEGDTSVLEEGDAARGPR